jgi:CRISPR system Cascade subunit CasC
MKIEVHILQSIGVNRMNSNGDGQPKSIQFGGYNRARISSQAQKRAARMYTHEFGLLPESELATRTRRFTQLVAGKLLEDGIAQDEAEMLATRGMAAIGMSHKVSDKDKIVPLLNEYLILCSSSEINAFAEAIFKYQDAIRQVVIETPSQSVEGSNVEEPANQKATNKPLTKAKIKKASQKEFPEAVRRALEDALTKNRKLEVALYGRYLADFPDGTVDGQVQVAHAIAVHQTLREDDFFVAIDDHALEDEASAGMLGEVGITAPTMYRVAAVNVGQLAMKVQSIEAARQGARAFLEAFTLALPSSGKNSYFATSTPTFVLFRQVLRGEALTLAPAFEFPVSPQRNRSLMDCAIERVDKYIKRSEEAFPAIKRGKQVCINLGDYEFQTAKKVRTLKDAIEHVLKEPTGEE